jgi:molybdate transport system substrate-binding protein
VRRALPLIAAVLVAGCGGGPSKGPTVYAAASLREAFPAIDSAATYDFAGSDDLQARIERGAPADVFASASPKQAGALNHGGYCSSPVAFATNRLVVIVPRRNRAGLTSAASLRAGDLRLAIGAQGVPVGDYTRKALAALGLSSVLKNVVSEEQDVKGVVAKVALGEADAGFVYRTDVLAAVRDVYAIKLPNAAQPVIRYELAVVKSTPHLYAARKFVARVLSRAGRLALVRAGFGLP